jgi:glutathione S-transferase
VLRDGDHVVMDSTPILVHLADHHDPDHGLFPGDESDRAAIQARLLEFDTMLGIAARRLCYGQVILECSSALSRLFLGSRAKGSFKWPGADWLAGHGLGLMLSKRFDIHRSEELGLYEALEAWLLRLSDELADRTYVMGDRFSAADLALAAQLRPLTVVPFFYEHPGLQTLFQRQSAVLARYSDEGDFPYQSAISEARQRRAPYRRRLKQRTSQIPFAVAQGRAANDQKEVFDWQMLTMPFRYRGIWRNKRRMAATAADWR